MGAWTQIANRAARLKRGTSLLWDGDGIRREDENIFQFAKRARTGFTFNANKHRFSIKALGESLEITKVGSWMEYYQQFADFSLMSFRRAQLKAAREEKARKEQQAVMKEARDKIKKEMKPWRDAKKKHKEVKRWLRKNSPVR